MASRKPKESAASYPNLKPIQPGEVRNPKGRNGVTKLAELRDYLDKRAEPTSRNTRRENILLALYTTAIDRRRRDHVAASKLLLAYDIGQPRLAVDISNESEPAGDVPNPLSAALEERIRRAEIPRKKKEPALVE